MKTVTKEEVERVLEKYSGYFILTRKQEILNELFPRESDSVNYKLKHLSKYCCKPANELEFEAVKMAAEIGGVEWHSGMCKFDEEDTYLNLDRKGLLCDYFSAHPSKVLIPVLDFCNKLRMSEEEAEKLEDDRVKFDVGENWAYIDGCKGIETFDGHYFRVSEDGLTVTLHKGEKH